MMSAESPRHVRTSGGGPLTVSAQPPSDRSLIDAVSGFINDVTLSSSSNHDPKDVIQWARFETADINEPTPEGDSDNDISPLLLILGYGSGVQVWLVPPTGEAQEVLSWRQGTVRVLRILPTPQHGDCYASKRPLIALCDSASPGPTFCSLSFISIRGGEQVKSIKFKNPILDVLANKRSVVVSFSERFAVFDAATLEDRMAITTCYPCPCPLGGSAPINPLALGDRWLAYADKKLNQSKRSSGGCEGEGQTSYTATVLHAAKSLSKGLRGLGESVAHSLAGGRSTSQSPSPPSADCPQPGVVTVLDVEGNEEDDSQDSEEPYDPIVAHFVAHSEAIIALKFDSSGMLLVTADRRGHDFHVFKINPHPCGPSLASVHHLYILHRGDTTAKVQDIAISLDSRWAAVSTLRGTTHVFALSPYGGACGVRTHTAPRVVNRLSRFHRSAGLAHPHPHPHSHTHPHPIQPSGSPVSEGAAGAWFPNPRLPPYPIPTVNLPLAQLRPTANLPTHTITRTSSGRQRLSSLSEDSNTVPLLARARFGVAPVPGVGGVGAPGGGGGKPPPTHALYLMSPTGCLSHIALHPRPARNIPKEKICDESPIELEVEGIAQWPLQRPPAAAAAAADLLAPLPPTSPLLQPMSCRRCADMCVSEEERWLSQVEIVTHAGPHRRLWMGPQFVFKTYNCTGSNSSLSEAETVEVDTSGVARSNPVNMPAARPIVPVLIDSGSASSLEHSPSDNFRRKSALADSGRAVSVCDVQLKEDLAEAMKEDHGWREKAARASPGGVAGASGGGGGVTRLVDPLGTVLAGRAPSPPPQPADADEHTRSNEDEARFRPVVRAPAALPPAGPEALLLRPLPRTTTIPVQTLPAAPPAPHPAPPPRPLSTAVIIPAALTAVDDWHVSNALREPADEPEPCEDFDDCEPAFGKCAADAPPPPQPAPRAAPEVPYLRDTPQEYVATSMVTDVTHEKKIDKATKKAAAAEARTLEDDVALKPAPANDELMVVKESKRTKTPERKEASTKERKSTKKHPTIAREKFGQKEITLKDDKPATIKDTSKLKTNELDATATDVACIDSLNVDVKSTSANDDLKRESDARKHESARERGSVEAERERELDHSKSLPKSNQQPDDIQPAACVRVKKSPTPKSVSDRDSEVSSKEKNKRSDQSKEVKPKEFKETKVEKEPEEIIKQKDEKIQKGVKGIKDVKETLTKTGKSDVLKSLDKLDDIKIDKVSKKDEVVVTEDELMVSVNLKTSALKDTKQSSEDNIKTEEQAWDLLLNEPDKPITYNISNLPIEDKPKSKKNKKINKKTQEESQSSREDDSFVEIHAIEESAQQPSSGELVSISTPFEDIEHASLYLSKTKKRLSKSLTPEKKEDSKSSEVLPQDETEQISLNSKICKNYNAKSNIEALPSSLQIQNEFKELSSSKVKKHYDVTSSESASFWVKETLKSNKSKSLSPYPEFRRSEKPMESEKDVYVINTAEEEFPEIQITTRAPKPRKRSPQLIERQTVEKEPEVEKPFVEKEPEVEKPIKSWSSIAASKNLKKVEDEEKIVEAKIIENIEGDDGKSRTASTLSLHDKLFELCKRTDIMVAECDAPSELNFVEEHHAAVLQDLPPLEPLNFGLDEFKLEVMRDSLLEVNEAKITSPICKINIDDILSSIKETTAKAIESSVFNLIDLEKVPAKKEKGFSVIAEQKITSQEVKLDDDYKINEKESEIMEKSSEDDTSPVVSTDSDKDEKKIAGASNLVLPLSKQSAKSKKSRRKKK